MERDLDDTAILKRLIFESTVSPLNNAYRSSVIHSLGTVAYFFARSRRLDNEPSLDLSGEALCFGFFKNELSAIDAALCVRPGWRKLPINIHALTGVEWRKVFSPAPRLMFRFLRVAFRLGGTTALRNFAYPFIGYLLFRYLEPIFRQLQRPCIIVTTNLLHPLSVAIHLAAVRAGLPTVFWEHAMTPRMIAREISKDMPYSEYYVNCRHTKRNFLDAGVADDRVHLLGSERQIFPVPMGDARKLQRIGVAVNDLDNLREVELTLKKLRDLGRNPVLRVHDSDKRFRKLARIASRNGVALSNAAHTPISEFLGEVDLIVAGNSNVVLDCLKANKRVIYYWPGDPGLFDYYGIVTAMSLHYVTNLDQLAEKLGYDGK